MNPQKDMENEISLIREEHNDSVNKYNERKQTFPDRILAKRFGFTKKRYV
ncbi:LemA family protein [Marinicellulosiphila megalodicopiae]